MLLNSGKTFSVLTSSRLSTGNNGLPENSEARNPEVVLVWRKVYDSKNRRGARIFEIAQEFAWCLPLNIATAQTLSEYSWNE
ncbi:hypothetical protein [Gordonia rhizosphera]|uniref:hypothetical protein n=1 Tax=Gordonia rhizosphera TaxID=83341 RepID=UPI003F4FB46A